MFRTEVLEHFHRTPPNGSVGGTEMDSTLKSLTTDAFTGTGSTNAFTLSEEPIHKWYHGFC